MSDFTPKSLDDIDSEFIGKNASSLSSAATKPETDTSAVKPPQAPPAPVKNQSRESLIPTPVFYKAAPMQAPLPDIDEPDYIPIGKKKDSFADLVINSEEGDKGGYSLAPSVREKKGMSTGRNVLAVFSCIMLVLTVLVSAFFAVLTRMCDNTAYSVKGYYICSVRETTVSPLLTDGDITFVKGIKPENISQGSIVACIDKESKTYFYGVVDEIMPEDTGNTAKVKIEKTLKEGSDAVITEVPETTILGTADYFFPRLWLVLSRINASFYTLSAAAALLTVLWILLFVGSFKFFLSKEQDDD